MSKLDKEKYLVNQETIKMLLNQISSLSQQVQILQLQVQVLVEHVKGVDA